MKRVVVELFKFSELKYQVQYEILCHDACEFGIDPEILRQRYEALGEIFTADGMMLLRKYPAAGRDVQEIQDMISLIERSLETLKQGYESELGQAYPDATRLAWMRKVIDAAEVRLPTLQWAAGLRGGL